MKKICSLFHPDSDTGEHKIPYKIHLILKAVPRYAIYLLIVLTPLARASVHGWSVYIIHIVTLIALSAFLLEKNISGEWKRVRTSLDKPLFTLSSLVLLSALFSVNPRVSFEAVILFADYIIIFYLVIHTVRTRSQFRHIVFLIISMAVFLSVFGFFKSFGVNPFYWWDYPDLNQSGYRITSTFGNPDHLAGYMEMALPLILGLFLKDYKGGKRFLMIYLTIIISAALVMTLSRGGWIGSLAGMTFMSLSLMNSRHFKHKKLLIALIIGFASLMFIVLNSTAVVERIRTITDQEEMTIYSRMLAWEGVIEMIKDYPLAGTGPGTFSFIFTQYQSPGLNSHFTMAHNDYLHFISETGIFLIPVIMWFLFSFYKRVFKKMKNRSRLVRGITLGSVSGVTAILVHSMADFNLHIPANALLFTILTAVAVAPSPD